MIDWGEPISVYTTAQAVEDGIKAYIFENRWQQLSGGKPITATATLMAEVSLAGLIEVWNEFATWAHDHPEPEYPYTTEMNGPVWLMEDGECFTLMRPSDY